MWRHALFLFAALACGCELIGTNPEAEFATADSVFTEDAGVSGDATRRGDEPAPDKWVVLAQVVRGECSSHYPTSGIIYAELIYTLGDFRPQTQLMETWCDTQDCPLLAVLDFVELECGRTGLCRYLDGPIHGEWYGWDTVEPGSINILLDDYYDEAIEHIAVHDGTGSLWGEIDGRPATCFEHAIARGE